MIHYFVLFLILMAASSIGAFSLLQMNQSTQSLIKAQSERQNLDQWEYALINKLEPVGKNQGLAAPVGINDPTDADGDGNPDIPYQMLPNGLGMSKTNAWGRPFVYCPTYPEPVDFSLSTRTVWTGKTQGDTSNYLTGIVTDHAGVEYVVQADPSLDASLSGRNVLAMLISPLPSSATPPSCQDVTYDPATNQYKVPNGIVRVIEQNHSVAYLAGGRTVTVVNSDNYATQNLSTMLDKVAVNVPDLIMVDLSSNASSYTLDSNYTFTDASPGNHRSVVIEGDAKATTVISAATPVTLTFDGVDVLLKNITLADNVKLSVTNGELTTDNVELSQTRVEASDWFVKNNVEIIDNSASGLSLEVVDSEIHQGANALLLKGGVSKNTISDIRGSSWTIDAGQLTIETTESLTSGLSLSQGSNMVINNGSITFQRDSGAQFKTDKVVDVGQNSKLTLVASTFNNTYPASLIFSVTGELIFDNSTLTSSSSVDKAIQGTGGGVLTLKGGSQIGLNTAPSQAVTDAGMRFVLGASAAVYGTQCWTGPIFTDVASQNSGTSQATTPQYEIFNQSNWTCNL